MKKEQNILLFFQSPFKKVNSNSLFGVKLAKLLFHSCISGYPARLKRNLSCLRSR